MLGAYKSNDYNAMYADLTAGTVTENHNTSSFAPVFSPVIQVSDGRAVEGQVSAGLQAGFDQFVEFMERYQNERYRAAF